MPSSYGYTYVVISLAVVALGVCWGLWCSNNSTALEKTKEQINRSHDWTSTLARLQKVKTNLELKVKQLQEDYVTLESKIESARMTLEKDRHPQDQLSSKPVKLQISSVCEIEVKEHNHPGQIQQMSYGALSVSSQPLHVSFSEDSLKDEQLNQNHSTFPKTRFGVREEHFETNAAGTEAVDLESVSRHTEPSEGKGIKEDTQDGMFLLEHKQQFSEKNTVIKDQVAENKVRKLQQENKEYEIQKNLLSKKIQELQLLRTKLEDQVRQLKGKRREMRTSSLRGEMVVNFPKDSNALNSGNKRSASVDHFTNRHIRHDCEILHERLKHIREKSFAGYSNKSIGHMQSLRTSNDIEEEPSETQNPLFLSNNKSQSLSSIGTEDKLRPGTIDELSRTIVILEENENHSDSHDGSEWTVSSMFLT